MDHPPDERLTASPLDPDVREHLETCPSCRERISRAGSPATWGDGAAAADDDVGPLSDGPYLSEATPAGVQRGELEPGAVIAGHVVEAEIGRGGMARVYRVRHQVLGTPRALKVLQLSGPAIAERFLREGRAMAGLDHPNILRVIDVVSVMGLPALLLDLVDRGSLDDHLRAGRMRLSTALGLFRGIVAGVAAAHQAGLVHRDLKPANVLLATGPHGELVPRVSDFGLAKALSTGDRTGTRTGATMGTLVYMAPEQVRDASRVDARADLFSLGCILYELITGHHTFSSRDPIEQYEQATRRAWVPVQQLVPEAPDELVELVDQLLAPEREDRPASADEVLERLEWIGSPTHGATPTPSRASATPKPTPRSQAPVEPAVPRLRPVRLAVALLVPAFVAFTGLSDTADLALQTPLLRAFRGALPADDVVVLGIQGRQDLRALRGQHPAVIDALVDAGARAIVFDLGMSSADAADGLICAAIARAAKQGVEVLLPVRVEGEALTDPSPELKAAAQLGVVELRQDLVFGRVREIPVRRRRPDGSSVWHLALEAARAHQRAPEIRWADHVLSIGALRVPATQESMVLPPTEAPPRISYNDPGGFGAARGKVALIGVILDEDLKRTPEGPRYGVEVLATAVQTALRQASVRRLSRETGTLVGLAATLATVNLAWWLPGRARWLLALVPVALIGVVAALAAGGTVLTALPALVGCLIAATAVRGADGPPSGRAVAPTSMTSR